MPIAITAAINVCVYGCVQPFRLRPSTLVGERNRRIQYAQSSAKPIPDSWVAYAKTLECTHAVAYKYRGKGMRTRQETRSMQCPTKVRQLVALQTL